MPLSSSCLAQNCAGASATMADFDAIYEDSSVDAGAAGGAGAAGAAGGGGGGGAASSALEDSYTPAPTLVPDPVIVRGAGNITV